MTRFHLTEEELNFLTRPGSTLTGPDLQLVIQQGITQQDRDILTAAIAKLNNQDDSVDAIESSNGKT